METNLGISSSHVPDIVTLTCKADLIPKPSVPQNRGSSVPPMALSPMNRLNRLIACTRYSEQLESALSYIPGARSSYAPIDIAALPMRAYSTLMGLSGD
jgi:hypothetical protein